jgi:hypothetical protein
MIISKARAMEIAAGYASGGSLGMPFATLATTGTISDGLTDAIERELKDPRWNTTRRRELKALRNYARVSRPVPTPFRWQYIDGGMDISHHPFCEQDATEARAWYGAHGDEYAIVCVKTRRGRWAITSFGSAGEKTWYRLRFSSPDAALDWYGRKRGWDFCVAECRCDIPGMDCD